MLLAKCPDRLAAVNRQRDDGTTPVNLAAGAGQAGAVQWLIERGADVNLIQTNGNAPLKRASQNGHPSPAASSASPGSSFFNPSALRRYTECCVLCLRAGAHPNHVNKQGETALHYAAKNNHFDCVKATAAPSPHPPRRRPLPAAAAGPSPPPRAGARRAETGQAPPHPGHPHLGAGARRGGVRLDRRQPRRVRQGHRGRLGGPHGARRDLGVAAEAAGGVGDRHDLLLERRPGGLVPPRRDARAGGDARGIRRCPRAGLRVAGEEPRSRRSDRKGSKTEEFVTAHFHCGGG